MKKGFLISILILGLLTAFYFAGPRPEAISLDPSFPEIEESLNELDHYLAVREAAFVLRKDNEARIIWADSIRQTEWVVLYLHGFSASQGEGAPLHQHITQKLGANLLLARLAGHGYRNEQLGEYTAIGAWEDAKEYLALAEKLGQKVLIMGTSTGCSYALNLAAEFPEKVKALINLSPNIRVKDPNALLLDDPWGEQIAHLVLGDQRRVVSDSAGHALYWDTLYTVHALVELENLLESTLIPETFAKVKQPVLNLCYYKSDAEQDPVVSVEKIEWMHDLLGTAENQKRLVKLDKVGNHVLGSPIKSKDVPGTEKAISDFLDEILLSEN